MMLSPGTQIGPYKIISALGAGGMGEVYRAQDERLDRVVAFKVLPADVAEDQERMRRFELEAKAASKLSHPNVAHIYEIGTSNEIRFIAMEYVEGLPLDAKIKGLPLEVSEIIDIGINYNVPPELERIIRKCLEKDPDRRYQAARELYVDLKNLKRDRTRVLPQQRPRITRNYPCVIFLRLQL